MAKASSLCDSGGHFKGIIHGKEKPILRTGKKVKTLASYVFTVTEKSPKKFRFTLVNRLQNYTLDIIECIIKGNASRDVAYRLGEQQKAKALLNLFDAFAEMAMQEGCLLMKQYEVMSKMVAETLDYLHK
jgi:hypothetical protein